MNYPLISEYIEAIKSAEDNFEELSYLRPVLGDDGQPVMTSGNFAVVFKMKDVQSGKYYAVKCFIKEQEGRNEAYREIAKELKDVSSPYLVSIRYLEKELFVDTDQSTETEFPVLLMDWVEGKTLDKYLRENLDDKYALEMLTYRFSQLAQWLIPQSFAHGDLKPDNILVREDGSLVLVDYDGMYVPAMKGQKARELGSPDFRHPMRTEDDFDEHIDDFPLVSILLSLKTISVKPLLLNKFGAESKLLFSEKDYKEINKCKLLESIQPSIDDEINKIYSCFRLFFYNDLCLKNHKMIEYLTIGLSKQKVLTYTDLEEHNTSAITPFDLVNTWVDEYGVTYSKDGKKLIKGGRTSVVFVREGTIVICDSAFNEQFKTKYRYNKQERTYEFIGERLQAIKIPNSVKVIGKRAFYGCKSLERIDSLNSVEEIGALAFCGCERLFNNLLLKNVKIVQGPIDKYIIPTKSTSLCYEDGVLYDKKKESIYSVNLRYEHRGRNDIDDDYYLKEKPWWAISYEERELRDTELWGHPIDIYSYFEIVDLIIPETIFQIGDYAFYGSEGIGSIIIPYSVHHIGEGAFVNSSIECLCITNPYLRINRKMFGSARPKIAVPLGYKEKYEYMLCGKDDEVFDTFEIIEWDGWYYDEDVSISDERMKNGDVFI